LTTTGKRRGRPPAAVPAEEIHEIKEGVQRIREVNHQERNRQVLEEAAERILARKLEAGKAKDVPLWLKATGVGAGAVVSIAVIVGLIWNFAISPVVLRLEALERSRTENTSALITAAARIQAVEAKALQIETKLDTATTVRNQQQQAMADRMRMLEQSDANGAERLAQLAQTIASILPRLEEILRRQERLENRLSAPMQRNGADDETPAVWAPAERNI
jgi:hypothetical protein